MDPGETIKQAVEREVYEETGVKTIFQGIIGLRETLEARYAATDLYLVCLVTVPGEDNAQTINIIDQREIFQAKWIPLSGLTHNNADAEHRMFPNAWKFVSLLNQRLVLAKEHKLPLSLCLGTGAVEEQGCLSGAELMKQVTMTHEVFAPAKGKPYMYYISEPIKFTPGKL